MKPGFQSESWEQTGPSYIQAYIVSGFFLFGLLGIASHRVPLTPLSFIFMSVWFGTLLYWLIQNRRAERTFASDRITVADGRVKHTFRYTITEAKHSEIAVGEVKEMKIHHGTPIAIELVADKDSDFFILPNQETVARLERTLLQQNPKIQVTR